MPAHRCPNPNCEYFNRILPNNAKVCPMCGTSLGNAVTPPSAPAAQPPVVIQPSYQAPLYQPPAHQVPAHYVPPSPQPVYVPPPRPTRPVLKLIHSSGNSFCLPGEEGFIGRRGQTSRTVPEIDLTGISNEGIVSRSHARIYWDWSQNAYIIIDNNSRNRTFVNGNLLTLNTPYCLNHGDSLQLGQNNLVCFTVSLI